MPVRIDGPVVHVSEPEAQGRNLHVAHGHGIVWQRMHVHDGIVQRHLANDSSDYIRRPVGPDGVVGAQRTAQEELTVRLNINRVAGNRVGQSISHE